MFVLFLSFFILAGNSVINTTRKKSNFRTAATLSCPSDPFSQSDSYDPRSPRPLPLALFTPPSPSPSPHRIQLLHPFLRLSPARPTGLCRLCQNTARRRRRQCFLHTVRHWIPVCPLILTQCPLETFYRVKRLGQRAQ